MSKVVVTGATGFVGSALVRILGEQGHDVYALHRPATPKSKLSMLQSAGARTVVVDGIGVRAAIEDVNPDVIFHLAAHFVRVPTAEDVERYLDANIAYGWHVLEAASPGTVVVSAMSYFQFRDGVFNSHSLYAASKQAFMQIEKFYRDHRGIDVRDVVLYDNIGPRDARDKLLPQLIAATKTTRKISLGPSKQRLNILHVDDVARGLVAAAFSPNPTSIFGVFAPKLTTVGEVVGLLRQVSGVELDSWFDESIVPSDLVDHSGSWPTPVGWAPKFGVAEAVLDSWLAE